MDVIKGILHEELENSLRILKRYEEEISDLPRGSIFKRRIGGHSYYYMSFRDSSLGVRQRYLGKLSDEQAEEYKAAVEKRRRYEKQSRELKMKISYLRKVLRDKAD